MATIGDWQKYINVVWDLALVEDDLRETVVNGNQRASVFAASLLRDRFGVNV